MKRLKKINKKRWIIILGAIIVATCIFVAMNFQSHSTTIKENPYKTTTLKRINPLIFNGIVQATHTQDYYVDQTLGKISGINVRDGQEVSAGTALLSYKNAEYQNQADEQTSSLDKLYVAVSNAQETLANAQNRQDVEERKLNDAITNYNNTNENSEDGALKKEQYKQEKIQYESSLDAANDAVIQAKQALENANVELSTATKNTNTITQKVSSTITSVSDGTAYINENGKNDPSIPIIKIVSNDVVVEAKSSEYDYPYLSENESVTIKPITSNQKISGTITQINKLPDQDDSSMKQNDATGSASKSVSNFSFIVKPSESLQYGFNVQVVLPLDEIRLPKRAVVKSDDVNYVFAYRKGKIHEISVETEDKGDYLILKEGLKAGDRIISNPDKTLRDGQKLAVD